MALLLSLHSETELHTAEVRLRLLNQALTMEHRGRGRGCACNAAWESGSRSGGREGGTKAERQEREVLLISEDGGE